MKTCPNCSNHVEDNKNFCNKCGTPVSNVVFSTGNKTNYTTYSLLAVIGWNILIPVVFLVLRRLIAPGYYEHQQYDEMNNVYLKFYMLNYIIQIILLGLVYYFSKTSTTRIIMAIFLLITIVLFYFNALSPFFS
jgi:uncharacterized membrane protein YvbJ